MIDLIEADAIAPQPWRNGGGRTRELLAWPRREDWHVRVSLADIEADGPFSAFPGVRRWFAVIEGAGVVLDFAGREQRMTPRDSPLQFDGAAAPGCRLIDGPTRDLNLMLRDNAHGVMQAVTHGKPWSPAEQPGAFFAAVAGNLQVGDTLHRLPARGLLCFDQPLAATLAFHADAPAAGPVAPVGYHLSYSA